MTNGSLTQDKPVTGRKVFWYLVAAFSVITIANGSLTVAALKSFTGNTQEKAYAMGLEYNRTLNAVAAQRARGWKVSGELQPLEPGRARLVATYHDVEGRSLDYLDVSAKFMRPTVEGHDFEVQLKALGDGLYVADVDLPFAGRWNVRTSADDRSQPAYLLDYRFVAP